MGFEGFSSSSKRPSLVTHKRSRSFPDNRRVPEENNLAEEAHHQQKLEISHCKKKPSSNVDVGNSLRQEILKLEKRLQDQVCVRFALEKALGYKTSSCDINNEATIPKPATQLIREIAVLELEVGHLEQYLLSLYRKAFDQQISRLSPIKENGGSKFPLTTPRRRRLAFSTTVECATKDDTQILSSDSIKEEKFLDSSVQRSHSSLSERTSLPNRTSPPEEAFGSKAVRACHSQPLSMMENSSSHVISLAEHLRTRIPGRIQETPNKLSEDMVKCMCDIYCKLSDPPLPRHHLMSPASSLSSISISSALDQCDMWSPGFRHDSSFDTRLDNPFLVEGLKDFSGPYSSMVEVHCIYRDSRRLGKIEYLLTNFRSLISRLEEIDPRKMTRDEKLAFWINVHNALVMHAFLAYGIPPNNMKRMLLLLKAAYNVGGQIISADIIQSSILGCRMSHPGEWLMLLFSSKTKFQASDKRQAYGITRPEPLLYFALSSGSHSDPAVRIFTPKRIFQELEAAKEDYVRATFGVRKDDKIILPKIIDSFAKESGICQAGILEMIQQSLPDSLRKSIMKCQQTKNKKKIEWVPHNFAFRAPFLYSW